jgi:hypothetical protein
MAGIALLILVWIEVRKGMAFRPQTASLPTGSTLELYHVTWGTNHHRVVGGTWASLALRVPRTIRTAINWRPAAIEDAGDTKTPVLLLWFRESSNTIQPHQLVLTAVGDSGEELALNPHLHNWLGSSSGSKSQTFWAAQDVFPWRTSSFKLRVYRKGSDSGSDPERCAEFTIPNPRAGHHPRWRPEPIPATRTNGSLAVTLDTWQPVTRLPAAGNAGHDRGEFWHQAKLRVRENGRLTEHWYLAQGIWQDATGNRALNSGARMRRTAGDDRLEVWFSPLLSTNETALKLGLGFARDALGSFAPEERVPGTNELVEPDLTNNLQGAQIILDSLSGPRTPDGPILRRAGRKLVVRFVAPAELFRVLVLGITDERGRPVPLLDGWSQSDSEFEFGVNWPADVSTVDLTLAVQRIRWVEFRVPPYAAPP